MGVDLSPGAKVLVPPGASMCRSEPYRIELTGAPRYNNGWVLLSGYLLDRDSERLVRDDRLPREQDDDGTIYFVDTARLGQLAPAHTPQPGWEGPEALADLARRHGYQASGIDARNLDGTFTLCLTKRGEKIETAFKLDTRTAELLFTEALFRQGGHAEQWPTLEAVCERLMRESELRGPGEGGAL